MKRYADLSLSGKRVVWAWGFLAVPIAFYTIVRFYPTANAALISFQDWNLLGTRTWAGLDNYRTLVADPVFWKVLGNTFQYLLIGTPLSLVLAFGIAYQLDKVRFMHGTIRALYFLPFMTSAVAMAWVWRWFYQPVPIGTFNNIIASFGLPQVAFLNSTTNALPAVLAPALWAGLGFQIIIFMAGLRAIPKTYYEAARIDGVSSWTILTEITIPAAQAHHRLSRGVQLDRVPQDLRSRVQHDHQQSRRPAELDQTAGADDLRHRVQLVRHGLRRRADHRAVHDPAGREPAAASAAQGPLRVAGTAPVTPGGAAAGVEPAVRASSAALLSGGGATGAGRRPPRRWGQAIRWLLLFGGGVLMVMPLVFMMSTSFKFPFEVYSLNLIPEEPTLDNYAYVLERRALPELAVELDASSPR